jgi:hypothetical protein
MEDTAWKECGRDSISCRGGRTSRHALWGCEKTVGNGPGSPRNPTLHFRQSSSVVEQRTHKPLVAGSIPASGTSFSGPTNGPVGRSEKEEGDESVGRALRDKRPYLETRRRARRVRHAHRRRSCPYREADSHRTRGGGGRVRDNAPHLVGEGNRSQASSYLRPEHRAAWITRSTG